MASQQIPKMLSEKELRKKLKDLDEFWQHEIDRRGGSKNPIPPVDCYWYIYTRQAYLEILGEKWPPLGEMV